MRVNREKGGKGEVAWNVVLSLATVAIIFYLTFSLINESFAKHAKQTVKSNNHEHNGLLW